jgi:hypothetical protein
VAASSPAHAALPASIVTGNNKVRIRNILLIFFIKSSFMVGQIPRWL